jgi:sialic acid synthase SpsE
LIRASARTGRPIIISSGSLTLDDLGIALACIRDEGNPVVCCLHCVSDYPVELADCNLGMIRLISDKFGIPSGYSDHSLETSVPMAAVALGARVIEKHVTMDRNLDGPDHHFALEPDDLAEMVRGIREIEPALGKTSKYPVEHDDAAMAVNNKGFVARIPIPAGAKIEENMLAVKRIRSGIRPADIGVLLGKKAVADIAEDDIIEPGNLE